MRLKIIYDKKILLINFLYVHDSGSILKTMKGTSSLAIMIVYYFYVALNVVNIYSLLIWNFIISNQSSTADIRRHFRCNKRKYLSNLVCKIYALIVAQTLKVTTVPGADLTGVISEFDGGHVIIGAPNWAQK